MMRPSWPIPLLIVCFLTSLAAMSGAHASPTDTGGTNQGRLQDRQAPTSDPARRLAVAWYDSGSESGLLRAMSVLSPWEFTTPPLETDPDSVLRSAGGRVYVVSRTAGTITVVASDTWTPLEVHSLGDDSGPQDIAVVSPQGAYVTRGGATHLLRLDLFTGATEEVVDLGVFADDDGVPDMGMMAVHEGRLFVQIRRFNSAAPGGYVLPAYLAVVDIATEQLIDANPAEPGVQAIELQGTPPRLKMQIVPQTRRLFVSATGFVFDAGGIEVVDLDTLQSLGLVVSEAEDEVGVDVGPFIMVTPDRGYLVCTTDWVLSSHLTGFSISGGVDPGPDLYVTVEYFAPTLEFDPKTNTFFFPDGNTEDPGVCVFDAATGALLTPEPIPTSGSPTDLVLCDDSAVVPTMSEWGLTVTALLFITCGIAVVRRRQQHFAT